MLLVTWRVAVRSAPTRLRYVDTDLIGTAEAAEILGVHRSSVRLFVGWGWLDPVAKGRGARGAFVFRRADVDRLRDERASARYQSVT